jgi:hypothetical protein
VSADAVAIPAAGATGVEVVVFKSGAFEGSSEVVLVFLLRVEDVPVFAGSTLSSVSVGCVVSGAAFVVFLVARRGRVEPEDCA